MIDYELYLDICREFPNYTFLFECCHSKYPHIITVELGMYYLGMREKTWDSIINVENVMFEPLFKTIPTVQDELYIKLKDLKERIKHEGYVCYTHDDVAFKIKSPFYLFNTFLSRCKNTSEILDKNIDDDEEFYPLLFNVRNNIEYFIGLTEQDRL